MIGGVRMVLEGHEALWGRNHIDGQIPKAQPVAQPGFNQTSMGQNQFVVTERHQITPAGMMGRTAHYDRLMAETHGGVDLAPGWTNHDPRGNVLPLQLEPDFVKGRRQQIYEYDYLTPHGAVEDVLLYRKNATRAPPATAYTIPTIRPVAAQPVVGKKDGLWQK